MTDPHRERPRTVRRDLSVAAIVLAVIFAVCGLATVGFGLLVSAGLNNWSMNK